MSINSISDSSKRVVDVSTALVVVIVMAVAGYMSAQGAKAVFPSSAFLPYAFAAVVQIIVTMTLWALPRTPPLRRVLLLTVWLASASISVSSAFFMTEQANRGEVVAQLKDGAIQSMAEVKKNTSGAKIVADAAAKAVVEERNRGTFSNTGTGYGPKARELARASVQANARVTEAEAADKVIEAALEDLRKPGLTTEDVRAIYNETMLRVGPFADGVKAPDFSVDRRSFATVTVNAYLTLFGRGAPMNEGERMRLTGSLGAASIMEILALLCALIRMEMHREARTPNPGGGGGGPGGRVVDAIVSFVRLPEHLRDSLMLMRQSMVDAALKRDQAIRKSQSDLFAGMQTPPPQTTWMSALLAHMRSKRTKSFEKVIKGLIPGYRGSWRVQASFPVFDSATLFDARVFSNAPFILQGLLCTRAVQIDSNGTLSPGPQWEAWIHFLISIMGDPPTATSRKPKAPQATARPKLRVV
jgi:hypothetical protein